MRNEKRKVEFEFSDTNLDVQVFKYSKYLSTQIQYRMTEYSNNQIQTEIIKYSNIFRFKLGYFIQIQI